MPPASYDRDTVIDGFCVCVRDRSRYRASVSLRAAVAGAEQLRVPQTDCLSPPGLKSPTNRRTAAREHEDADKQAESSSLHLSPRGAAGELITACRSSTFRTPVDPARNSSGFKLQRGKRGHAGSPHIRGEFVTALTANHQRWRMLPVRCVVHITIECCSRAQGTTCNASVKDGR